MISENSSTYFLEMKCDLLKLGLIKTLSKWDQHFKNDFKYLKDLAKHLLKVEYRYQAIPEIYKLSKYK